LKLTNPCRLSSHTLNLHLLYIYSKYVFNTGTCNSPCAWWYHEISRRCVCIEYEKKRRDMSRTTAVVTCGCVRAADHAVCYASDVAQVYTREKYHPSFPTHADATRKLAGIIFELPNQDFSSRIQEFSARNQLTPHAVPVRCSATDMGACCSLGRYRDFTAERPSCGVSSASLFRVGDFSL
jgi:hypothetical protein